MVEGQCAIRDTTCVATFAFDTCLCGGRACLRAVVHWGKCKIDTNHEGQACFLLQQKILLPRKFGVHDLRCLCWATGSANGSSIVI